MNSPRPIFRKVKFVSHRQSVLNRTARDRSSLSLMFQSDSVVGLKMTTGTVCATVPSSAVAVAATVGAGSGSGVPGVITGATVDSGAVSGGDVGAVVDKDFGAVVDKDFGAVSETDFDAVSPGTTDGVGVVGWPGAAASEFPHAAISVATAAMRKTLHFRLAWRFNAWLTRNTRGMYG